MTERYICIHGHFYQPPRENPWLEAIEIQDSAYPYHDWNERICAECYAPNSASRILDGEGRITHILSNYDKISFDFGPTLLSWMEANAPEPYQAVLDADRQSIGQRSGHGNALAQGYNHFIMPLANTRDKRTQILWGIKDFEYRFKRYPEGMWLPETAVDIETLDILAESGIKFTVLAPHQVSKVRRIGTGRWKDVSGGQIDPSRAYLCRLPSNREISLFFYDGQISRAASFEEELLDRGENFVTRLSSGFSDQRQWPQILNIATDGETYGHHHKFGDMALAFALSHIESNGLGKLTNYGEYLENFPPTHEVEIAENTSWSCAHGVGRWGSNCGCNSGKNSGWNQEWRAPLRASLDWLRDELAPEFERKAKDYLKDAWKARDEYIEVILNRSETTIGQFLKRHAVRDLTADEMTVALKLMEIQRQAMLMYTSCGWFFDELSGLETVQIIHYAGRAIQLSEGLLKEGIESSFIEKLSEAKSNLAEHKDGGYIYEKFVKTSMIDLRKVAAHYALSSTIAEYGDDAKIYSYRAKKEDYQEMQVEKTKLAVGRVGITSEITQESETIGFCVLHLGGHVFNGGVRTFLQDEVYQSMKQEIISSFAKGDFAGVVRTMDVHFGMHGYSLLNLFRDEQRKIVNLVIREKMDEFERAYRIMYENNNVLPVFLQEAGIPVPKIFLTTAEFILNFDMKKIFSEEKIDEEKFRNLMKDIKRWNITIDAVELEFIVRRALEGMMDKLFKNPSDLSMLPEIHEMVELIKSMPFNVNLWQAQNLYYKFAKMTHKELLAKAESGNEEASLWLDNVKQIGQGLFFDVGTVLSE
jgi:alpha-amylase/alpha-mannosidase (GH57 family)